MLAAVLMLPRVRMILDELQLARRERDRLQTELITRRSETSHARIQALRVEHDMLAMRRRLASATAERDEARVAQLNADAAYREILAERDRLKGELALSRRRKA